MKGQREPVELRYEFEEEEVKGEFYPMVDREKAISYPKNQRVDAEGVQILFPYKPYEC